MSTLHLRLLVVLVTLALSTSCGGDAFYTLRLDSAVLPAAACDGSDWDEASGPEPSVEVTANWDGASWESEYQENEAAPSWSVAVWDGAVVSEADLLDFGVGVKLWEYDFGPFDVDEPVLVEEATYTPTQDELRKDGSFGVTVGCASVEFSVLEADAPE